MLLSPLWAYVEARWIVYAITDQRLLKIRLFPLRKVQSYGPEDITGLERTMMNDGSGNIVFRKETHNTGEGATTVKKGFYGIQDVMRVEGEIIQLRQKHNMANTCDDPPEFKARENDETILSDDILENDDGTFTVRGRTYKSRASAEAFLDHYG